MLKNATSITAAKGKKVQRFENIAAEKAEILKQLIGPSGNLRAPTYRVGNAFFVGFNRELYASWLA